MLLLLLFSVALCEQWTVDNTTSGLRVRRGSGGLANAEEVDERKQNGWVRLSVKTNVEDAEHMFAAGFLEGFIHQKLTFAAFRNFANSTSWQSVSPPRTSAFIQTQMKWLRSQVNSSPYWTNVGLLLKQFDGMVAGYQAAAPAHEHLTEFDLIVYMLQDELADYVAANNEQAWFHSTFNGKRSKFMGSKCSVLVKLTPEKLFVSHDTWYDFNSMLRVFKNYKFGTGPLVSFSSYPLLPMSGDDYVITSNELAIVETTLNIFNNSLYNEYFKTDTVPYWLRVQLANKAKSAPEWHQIFSTLNNGGYNNEWMVVDYKLYSKGRSLAPNTFVVGEQIPGFYVNADLSAHLQRESYWASYNVPYFPQIYQLSGNAQMFIDYGNAFSWSLCPRAQVYKRDHSKVKDLEGMKKIQRSNKFQTDPLSLGSATGQISSRADLNSPWNNHTFAPFGGIDCKITDDEMIRRMETVAVCGPTYDSQPIFWWNDQFDNYPTFELPRVYHFDFIKIKAN